MNQEVINSLTFKKKYVSQVVFIISYEQNKNIRKKQFEIEEAMESLVRANSVNTNLPDDFDPKMPRVTLTQGKKIVTFSQIAAQLIINIDNSKDKSLSTIFESVVKQITLFKKCLVKIVPIDKQSQCGLVVDIKYSLGLANEQESCNHLFSNFFKVPSIGIPADIRFNVGYKVDDILFISFIVARYQQFKTKLDGIDALNQAININIDELEPSEYGVELKIDINNQPSIEKDDKTDKTDIILKKAINLVINESDNFMGLES